MNLHSLVRGVIPIVNPDIAVKLRISDGYVTLPNGKQDPQYTVIDNVNCQMQPLDSGTIRHLDALNIQGDLRSFRFNGAVHGVSRPLNVGGDTIVLPDGSEWLVVHEIEDWTTTAGWSHVAGQRQMANG